MSLFKFKKDDETKKCCCCKDLDIKSKNESNGTGSGIKILGGGCAKCNKLEEETVQALRELNMDTSIEHVRDYEKIASYGVLSTPALVIDGIVASYGKVLKKDAIVVLLQKIRQN